MIYEFYGQKNIADKIGYKNMARRRTGNTDYPHVLLSFFLDNSLDIQLQNEILINAKRNFSEQSLTATTDEAWATVIE